MRTKPAAALVPAALVPAAWIVAGLCVAAAGAALSSATGGALASGASFALSGPERCLALIGIALAAATGARRRLAIGGIVLGALLALAARSTPLWAHLTDAGVYRRLHLLGPLATVVAGLALLLPGRSRAAALPPAALFVGLASALTAVFNDPDPDTGLFALGAAFAILGLPLVVSSVVRAIRRPWFSIPERIAGSWCLAIGLLLAGVQLVPSQPPATALAAPPHATFQPDLDPMPPPDGGRAIEAFPGLGGREPSY